jgi:MarR family transcriptional regulator, lower aerobic nicotinate degradation pathway regulator
VKRARSTNGNLLWERPGFLVRRLHQIHSAMFAENCARFGVTPVQYSVLSVVREMPGLDQSRLAYEIGIDRSNAADVVTRMQKAGLIELRRGTEDRRTKTTYLTRKAEGILERLDPEALAAHEALLETLTPARRRLFLQLLRQLVADRNDLGRAPTKIE